MTTATPPDTWISPTPDAWLAGSEVFPRIAVLADTDVAALALLEERRAFWLSLPPVADLAPEG